MSKFSEKISTLIAEISAISLAGWMTGLGCFIGLPFVVLILELFIWGGEIKLNLSLGVRIIFTVMLLVLSVLYIVGTIALSKKEKNEKRRYSSVEDYLTYKKFIDRWGCYSHRQYEDYIVKASQKYMESIFEDNMNHGIYCSITDFFEDDENINNLYSIRLFSTYIRKNWERYVNREITVYCFLDTPYSGFSMTPLSNNFDCKYDKELLNQIKACYPDLFEKHFNYSQWSRFDSYDFSIGFRCADDFNHRKYAEDKSFPIFVKATGNLSCDDYSNRFIISNCRFEEASYEAYISRLNKR